MSFSVIEMQKRKTSTRAEIEKKPTRSTYVFDNNKFYKYLERVVEILIGKNKKIKLTPQNLQQMAQAINQYRGAFVSLIKDIDVFNAADQKSIQYIVTEIYSTNVLTIEAILLNQSSQIIDSLLSKYADPDAVDLVGVYLRIFTDSLVLSKGWLDTRRI